MKFREHKDFFDGTRFELGALHLLGKYSTTWATPLPQQKRLFYQKKKGRLESNQITSSNFKFIENENEKQVNSIWYSSSYSYELITFS
jgi:hypothetical protein